MQNGCTNVYEVTAPKCSTYPRVVLKKRISLEESNDEKCVEYLESYGDYETFTTYNSE